MPHSNPQKEGKCCKEIFHLLLPQNDKDTEQCIDTVSVLRIIQFASKNFL